ncbi:MAG: hypothetical protein HY916_09240 [Desulfovibrio sp.]|jgi:hypothetical protein|nr:hypothetical protein [Desulfovibrio sp.]
MVEDKGGLRLLEFQSTPDRLNEQYKAGLLETLEEIRTLAEAGVVVGVAVACIKREGGAVTAWSSGCGARLVDTLGAVGVLTARLHARIEKED